MSANEILVVAPEAGDRLVDLLRRGSWTVRPAQSCSEALDHLSAHNTSVVICESSLPDGNWKDLIEKAPRLIVTALAADEALWAEVLNLGGYDVLAQPFDATEVARVMVAAHQSSYRPVG